VLFVIDKGVVAESGSHAELLNNKGIYHKLVSIQVRIVIVFLGAKLLFKQYGIGTMQLAVRGCPSIITSMHIHCSKLHHISSVSTRLSQVTGVKYFTNLN